MQSLYSSIANATVRWFDFPGHGHPIVFIHGLACASSYDYPPVVAEPAFGNRRAILIDLPGFGYSDKPGHYDYSITSQAAVVVELIEKLSLQQIDLFGHSMGGSVAIQAAESLGTKVKTLAVSEPNFHNGGGFYSRKVVESSEQTFVNTAYPKLVAEEATAWKGCLQNASPYAMWRGAKSLVDGVVPSLMTRFQALTCQKALVFGAHSLPDEDASLLSERGIPLYVVPDAGHSMSWENPAGLSAVLGKVFTQNGS